MLKQGWAYSVMRTSFRKFAVGGDVPAHKSKKLAGERIEYSALPVDKIDLGRRDCP